MSSVRPQNASIVIVVPVYKTLLQESEQVALAQLNRVLGKYCRVFLAPESLDFDFGELEDGFGIARFPDRYFRSTVSYSNLLLSKSFYESFSGWDYMLVYHLDSFVFSDRLKEFCSMGYDYIGAPVFRFTPQWHAIRATVGNGGFSLRKISSAIDVLEKHASLFSSHPFPSSFRLWEDFFWGFCGVSAEIDFRVPTEKIAYEFSVDANSGGAYKKRMPGWLPFGCHGWSKVGADFGFWQKIISRHGYTLHEVPTDDVNSYRSAYLCEYLRKRSRMNLCLLYHAIRQNDIRAALGILLQWLEAYSENDEIWKYKVLEYLVVLQTAHRPEFLKDKFLQDIFEETVIEAIYRSIHSTGDMDGCAILLDQLLAEHSGKPGDFLRRLDDEVYQKLCLEDTDPKLTKLMILLHHLEQTREHVELETAKTCEEIWAYCEKNFITAETLLSSLPSSTKNASALLQILANHADKSIK